MRRRQGRWWWQAGAARDGADDGRDANDGRDGRDGRDGGRGDGGRRRRGLALTLMALLGSGLLMTGPTGCADADEPEPLTADSLATFYDQPAGYCEDTDELGTPYAPARPVWSDVAALGPHPQISPPANPGYSTPHDASRYPSYEWLSANLTLDQSIQFLISILTNSTSKLQSVQELVSSDTLATDLADMGVSALAGQMVEQSVGMCFCASSGSGSCDLANVQNQVQALFDDIATSLDIENVIDTMIVSLLDGLIGSGDPLVTGLGNGLQGAALGANLGPIITATLESWLVANLPSCTGLFDTSTALGAEINAAIQQLATTLQADIQALLAAWAHLRDVVWPQVKDSYEDLSAIISTATANGFSGLFQLDWTELGQQFNALVDEWKPVIESTQPLIDTLEAAWNDSNALADHIQQLISDLQTFAAAGPNAADACVAELTNLNPTGSTGAALQAALESALTGWWTGLLADIGLVQALFGDQLSGGAGSIDDYGQVFGQAVSWLFSGSTTDCFAMNTRPQCDDKCGTGNFVWVPEDFTQDPAAGLTMAAGSGMFVLKQTGFLDKVNEWLADNDFIADIASGVGNVLDVVQKITAILTEIAEILEQVEYYVDRFTEGYHIGAYDELRPDLHMCIGYAGHGAYAQFGNLGSDDFSIGARYTSHNLSANNRVQFHSGGFAVSAFGHDLSLAPGVEFQMGIDGWSTWDAQRPFGIPVNLTIDQTLFTRWDVFNVVPDDGPFGQVFANNPGAQVPAGAFVVKDLYPVRPNAPDINSTPLWPRPGVDEPWELRSAAVASAGLNLDLNFPRDTEGPFGKDLAVIPVYGPVPSVTIIPRLTLRFGAGWLHDTNHMRQMAQDAVNTNIPPALQLTEADFARDMHAFQAPDVSQDNGTFAYVEPGIDLGVFVGFDWKVISIGIRLGIGFAVNLRPGGYGGIVDLNAALAQALVASNPPADAPCEPVWQHTSAFRCTNVNYGGEEPLSCDVASTIDARNSCCVLVETERQSYRLCVDELTAGPVSVDRELCGYLNVSGKIDEVIGHLETAAGTVGVGLIQTLINVLSTANDYAVITSNWGPQSCYARMQSGALCRPDGDGEVVDLLPIDTVLINAGLSYTDCESLGACISLSSGDVTQLDVTEEQCAERERFEPYLCSNTVDSELTGWTGDGCHPLANGFPSACGCSADADCGAGETCNDGQCAAGGAATSCLCDTAADCSGGRVCVAGACSLPCSTDSQCPGSLVCDAGACSPPHGIQYAEQIVWGMANVEAPMHQINSYAWSDFLFTSLLTLGLQIGAELDLGFFSLEFTLLDLAEAFDLGSRYKHWYQPGLEARYQAECADEALDWPVTNRFPYSLTSPLADLDAQDVNPANSCGNGFGGYGVCRYCTPAPGYQANPEDYDDGNCGNVETFIAWCKDDMPQHQENPRETRPEDIAAGITDTYTFGENVGLDLWATSQPCINGQPWDEWIQSLGPTYDANGNITGGGFGDLDCQYIHPHTNQSWTFPCEDLAAAMMDIWSCSDQHNPWFPAVAGTFPSLVSGSPYDPGDLVVDVYDLFLQVPTFSGIDGWQTAIQYSIANLKPQYLTPAVILFTAHLQQCMEARSQDPAETTCQCTNDSDCGSYGRCEAGSCQELRTTDAYGQCYTAQCSPVWVDRTCSPVGLTNLDVGMCCGDGVVQQTASYSEACDPADPAGPQCSDRCQLLDERGACCHAGGCLQDVTSATCAALGGELTIGASCVDMNMCGMNNGGRGACCGPEGCQDNVTPATCARSRGLFHADRSCADLNECDPTAASGACCTDTGCLVTTADACEHRHGGLFTPGVSCDDVNHCDDSPRGACCMATGCASGYTAAQCGVAGGAFQAGQSCAQVNFCGDHATPASGVCCLRGDCVEDLTPEKCATGQGIWHDEQTCGTVNCGGSTEPVTGACCTADGGCTTTTVARCEAVGGAFTAGASCDELVCGGDPEPTGACCARGTCFEDITAALCEARLGTFHQGQSCAGGRICRVVQPADPLPAEPAPVGGCQAAPARSAAYGGGAGYPGGAAYSGGAGPLGGPLGALGAALSGSLSGGAGFAGLAVLLLAVRGRRRRRGGRRAGRVDGLPQEHAADDGHLASEGGVAKQQ